MEIALVGIATRWMSTLFVLVAVARLYSLSAQQQLAPELFFSAYIEPLYDDTGSEVNEDQLLELADMKSTGLGLGQGFNYTFTAIPRPPEIAAPLLPQSFLFPPEQKSRRFPPALRRYKRQTRFNNANSLGEHVFGHTNNRNNFGRRFIQAPSSSRFTLSSRSNRRHRHDFQRGDSFGHFPSLPFGDFNRHKMCAPEKQMRCEPRSVYRTIDGSCNNLARPKWGAINQPIKRLLPAVYFDGYDVPRLTSTSSPRRLLPSPRLVSRNIHEPAATKGHNLPDLTNLLQVWGQFLDHDITGTPAFKGPDRRDLKCCDGVYLTQNQQFHRDIFSGGRCNPIYIPPHDRHFHYSCMNFARSIPARRKRDCDPNAPKEIRQQLNMLTAWIDASQVYGSTMKTMDKLRVYHRGLMRVTDEDLLPEDTNSTCVKEEPGDYCFLAGEKRVNEHAGLMALHIVFHRYHNAMAQKLAHINPRWNDETLYQEVRRVMGAIMQHVTYHDWLPTVLGPSIMREYSLNVISARNFGPSYWRYDSKLDPTIFNAFATAAFRFGHTMIPSLFTMGDIQVRLFTMFNRPKFILQGHGDGLRKMCSGMIDDPAHHSDRFMTTDLSDRLFEDRNNISMDLASLNIQRARDHGLPPYNQYRKLCGLPVYRSFDDMYRLEPERAEIFRRVYENVDDIDLFAGGLSEEPLSEAVLGPTFACLLAKQFYSLKFSDRFWYENQDGPGAFTPGQLGEIRKITLSRVMCRMSNMHSVTANPLYKAGAFLPRGIQLPNGAYITQNRYVPCQDLPEIDFSHWYDPNAQT